MNLTKRRAASAPASNARDHEDIPDVPVSRFILEMQGGKKGLIVNSPNLCGFTSRATVKLTGQNGKTFDSKPVVQANCGKKGKRKRSQRGHR